MNWILIIALYSPGNDFIGKRIIEFETKKQCETVRGQLYLLDQTDPLAVKHKGVCVTKDHYTGKQYMPGMALD